MGTLLHYHYWKHAVNGCTWNLGLFVRSSVNNIEQDVGLTSMFDVIALADMVRSDVVCSPYDLPGPRQQVVETT